MNEKLGILCIVAILFAWKFYQHRKAILHNMNLYGEYIANLMRQKEDENRRKRKAKEKTKNERR